MNVQLSHQSVFRKPYIDLYIFLIIGFVQLSHQSVFRKSYIDLYIFIIIGFVETASAMLN